MIHNSTDYERLLDKKIQFCIKEYECGIKSLEDIAAEKNIDLEKLKRYVRNNNIKINPFYKKSIEKTENSFNQLQVISKNDPEAAVVINNYFESKLPDIKLEIGNLAISILEKTSNIVNNEGPNLTELKDASDIIKKISDTLGIFPKTPGIAIQNNVMSNSSSSVINSGGSNNEDMKIQIEFVKPPNYDDDEIEDLL